MAAPQRTERGEESAARQGIAGRLGQRQRGVEVGAGSLEGTERGVHVGAGLEQRRALRSRRPGALAGRHRLFVEREGLAVGVGTTCGRRGEARVARGVGPCRGLVVVVREHGRQLVRALALPPAQGLGRAPMQLVAARRDKGGARDLLRERVLEDVDGLLGVRLGVDELQTRKLGQWRAERPWLLADRLQERDRELASEDRGRLQHALGRLGQPVDARRQHAVHRVGDGDRLGAAGVIGDHASQLFEEERVAFSPVEDTPGKRVRRLHPGGDGADDGQARLRSQGPQGELRHVRAFAPGRAVPWTVGREQHHGRRRDAFDESAQKGLRGLVDPVQVLDEEDEGLAPARSHQELEQRVERARHQRPGLEGREPLVRRLDPEQVDEIRSAIGSVHAHGRERSAEPREHLLQ